MAHLFTKGSPAVMVVDDNADVRLLIRRVLWSAGYTVTTADGGRDALALLESTHVPDLVVLDVQMPELDGWGTLEAIRSNPRTSRLPVLLCSRQRTGRRTRSADGVSAAMATSRSRSTRQRW